MQSFFYRVKGIPCRARSGFAPYIFKDESWDHLINQYWDSPTQRWITIDADGFLDLPFSQFDIPAEKFDWAAQTWLGIRAGRLDGSRFIYADGRGTNSLKAVIRAIFYDFHCLMNNEISFNFQPCYIDHKFDQLPEEDFQELDRLAALMLDPDQNFDALCQTWTTQKKFRILNAPLIGDGDHVKWV